MNSPKKYLYQLLLFLIVLSIFIANLKPSTYLIGWDNFNSELNPVSAISQALNAGWSNFRSFGLVAGMGYAADLWHSLFVLVTSFFLPQNVIRYFFHCFLLFTGSLGVFSLFTHFKFSKLLSFIGALFYLLNFGTVQIFGLPYEPFSIFFGLLPWAFLTYFRLLNQSTRKNIIYFLIANFFLSGAFYVQTMFLVYLLCLLCLSLPFFFANRKSYFTNHLKIIFLILAINSYWLFTQIYFLASGSVDTVRAAKQTLLGWDIPYYQNYARSSLPDFFTQTGYYSDFTNSSGSSIFQTWLNFRKLPLIVILQITIIFTLIIGILDGQNKSKKYFLPLLLLHTSVLLMSLPIFSQLNQLLRQVSIIDQILRSPFSKFTMSLSLVFAYFFILGLQSISSKISVYLLAAISLFILALPSFQGHFFQDEVKITIPSEYFELSTFFHKQPKNLRIALFPETNIYGWYDYDWNYTGSGFLWHLIDQPIVSRSYDVWSRNSENYYWEITQAINSRNYLNIKNVFSKYQINYLIVDHSLNNGSAKTRSKQLDILDPLLNQFTPVFKSKNIIVYQITNTDLFSTTDLLPNVGPIAGSLNQDIAFANHGHYQTNPQQSYDFFYPFINLQTQTHNPAQLWKIKEFPNYFQIATPIPTISSPVVTDPSLTTSVNDNQLTVSFAKVPINFQNHNPVSDCSSDNHPKKDTDILVSSNLNLTNIFVTNQSKACWSYYYDDISGSNSYLLSVSPSKIVGPPPSFLINNQTTHYNLVDQQLNKTGPNLYIIPSTSVEDLGLSIHFQLQSYHRSNSSFSSAPPQLYLFPEQPIKNIYFTSQIGDISSCPISINSKQIAPWIHQIPNQNLNNYLIFNQSYSSGWLAFYFNGFRLIFLQHTLINNWANGWIIPDSKFQIPNSIYILFWPQLLQFLGFGLLIFAFARIIRK